MEYYNNVSASIDNDAYFVQMMNSSWNLDGKANTYKQYQQSWSEDSNQKQSGTVKFDQRSQRKGGYVPTKNRNADSNLRSGIQSSDFQIGPEEKNHYTNAQRTTGKRMGHVSPKRSTAYARTEAPGQESSQTNFTSDAYQHYDQSI